MMIIFSSFVLAGYAGSSNTLDNIKDVKFYIHDSCVGDVCVGSKRDVVLKVFSSYQIETVDLELEGFYTPALRVLKNNKRIIDFEMYDDTIRRIFIYSEDFQTEEGIRVGSGFQDLLGVYPDLKGIGYGEGGFFAWENDKSGIFFELDILNIPEKEFYKDFKDKNKLIALLRKYNVAVIEIIIEYRKK